MGRDQEITGTAQREQGRNAQSNNIYAAKLVGDLVRTTLGPKGMDKLLVDAAGEITVTNDGVTILEETAITHPIGRMMVSIASMQEKEVGDGTTTAVILAAELLSEAQKLLEQGVHPTQIISGFQSAHIHTQQKLREYAHTVDANDAHTLTRVAQTAMTGKAADTTKQHLSLLVVNALKKTSVVQVLEKQGAPIEASVCIQGVVLDKQRVHARMPKQVTDAKILLLDTPIELRESEYNAKVSVQSPTQIEEFLRLEEAMLQDVVKKIVRTGATVVCAQKGIDDVAAYHLAKAGILCIRRVKKSDLELLSKATGAQISSSVEDMQSEHLGSAKSVEERSIQDEEYVFFEGCAHEEVATIVLRANTKHLVEEIKRAVTDALGDVRAVLEKRAVVGGAGAIEQRLSRAVLDFAQTRSGKEQLAIRAFARALEVVPRTLAENAGLDTLEVLASQRASSLQWPGIGVDTHIIDSWQEGIIEPVRVKQLAFESAVHVANMILRIDDVIVSQQISEE